MWQEVKPPKELRLIGILQNSAVVPVDQEVALIIQAEEEDELKIKKLTPDKVEPTYNFTFDFRGATRVNFMVC